MIKYHFRDDLGKTKELLTMITKALGGNMIKDMPIYQGTKKRLLDAENLIVEKDKTIAEKDRVISDKG